ncbi:MAG: DUF1841 domain-containing protein [Zetaproteobacteria bacterium CG12_big_fil_rev_8_21_14_0_65_54_13]|nr:MAG: hypothetical protein COX55_09340 [Zetaproteobacteria bacterium CG23_combo_of_CG06-09_8_20_14_all_54_7]PIW47051.1 MAG: DUF1841 domain-containing protein [Zetaproteobacteria bacterium CG12_big_fil_rev_8_21_14_0_65_54_13]PIX53376.1 MAG: DUF1841 domain-containing protein [Zetaproteobacteria bacterium CG_4_10_14_3_um_filter_54_28]PJA30920.1 MAG: DUF1841 domain-containing protein [Zetaproteobacteria bacterium CG_4_9_14_3_um_filter_54_145]
MSDTATNRPSREQLRAHRQVFWDAWHKAQAKLPLNALEVRIARVIEIHPEYHHYFNDMDDFLDRDFEVDDGMNPYLHLSLHLALEEQAATRHPPEMAQALDHLISVKQMARHDALHKILEVLAETVFYAQRAGGEPDVAAYARCLRELATS